MYGKLYSSLYSGSMIGAGLGVFAVWPYVIANMRPDRTVGAQVEINPVLVSKIIDCDVKIIEDAIEFLCSPDPNSRTPDEDGRRLIKIGKFDYQVVNGPKYINIRDEEHRREQVRIAVQKHRQNKKDGVVQKKRRKKSKPLPGESEYLKAVESGATPEQLQSIEDKYAPAPGRFKNATGDEIGMVPTPKAGGEVYSDDGSVIDQV